MCKIKSIDWWQKLTCPSELRDRPKLQVAAVLSPIVGVAVLNRYLAEAGALLDNVSHVERLLSQSAVVLRSVSSSDQDELPPVPLLLMMPMTAVVFLPTAVAGFGPTLVQPGSEVTLLLAGGRVAHPTRTFSGVGWHFSGWLRFKVVFKPS